MVAELERSPRAASNFCVGFESLESCRGGVLPMYHSGSVGIYEQSVDAVYGGRVWIVHTKILVGAYFFKGLHRLVAIHCILFQRSLFPLIQHNTQKLAAVRERRTRPTTGLRRCGSS